MTDPKNSDFQVAASSSKALDEFFFGGEHSIVSAGWKHWPDMGSPDVGSDEWRAATRGLSLGFPINRSNMTQLQIL